MTSPVSIPVATNLTQFDIDIELEVDPNDSTKLLASYDGQSIPDTANQENLYVSCLVNQQIRFLAADFDEPAGQTWTLNAEPLTRVTGGGAWPRTGSTAIDSNTVAWPHGSNHLDVTLTATSQNAAGETQTRKRVIRVKMLTGHPMPAGLEMSGQSADSVQSGALE